MTAYLAPTTRWKAVTPSDTTVVACRGLFVGGTGNLSLQEVEGGPTVVFTAPALGVIHWISCYRVMAATTATAIVAPY